MNPMALRGNFHKNKGKLKKAFAVLTDNDLMYENGKRAEMLGKLQMTLGVTREELKKIIAEL